MMYKSAFRAVFLLFGFLLTNCYSTNWNTLNNSDNMVSAPPNVVSIFNNYPDDIMTLDAISPGYDYKYDIGEKDEFYDKDSSCMQFTKVELKLEDLMPASTVCADVSFIDKVGTRVTVQDVDLLRLIPKIDASGDMVYPELLLEEFDRFGYTFRREHDEFNITLPVDAPAELKAASERAYRCQIVNNCLESTKWEFALSSEDYSDYSTRTSSDINLNQDRILSHNWFYVDKDLYSVLFRIKNPGKDIDVYMPYENLSNTSENVFIDYNKIRNPIRYRSNSAVLEFGYKSNRKIEPLDVEQYYKKESKLLLSDNDQTYSSILETPSVTTRFTHEGFYTDEIRTDFDWSWMKYLDSVYVDVIDIDGSDNYVELSLGGQWTPYNITIGNIDLALLDEQKLYGLLFGINTYPKSRRYNPTQSTIAYDPDLFPDDIKPYVFLTDKKTGNWINNQYKGIEKIYLSYESLERDVLLIYVLSYERITPVWMTRVKLPQELREKVRIKNGLYNY